jgi:hypothetical protein
LQGLTDKRSTDLPPDVRALVQQIHREKDRLAQRLHETERKGNWDHIKTEFGRDWNKFIMDFEELVLRIEGT